MWFWAEAFQWSFLHWARMGLLDGIKHFWWASDPSPCAEASSYVEKGHRADIVASAPGVGTGLCMGCLCWSWFLEKQTLHGGAAPTFRVRICLAAPLSCFSTRPDVDMASCFLAGCELFSSGCFLGCLCHSTDHTFGKQQDRAGCLPTLGESGGVGGHHGQSSCRVWSRIAGLRANPYVWALLSRNISIASPQQWVRTYSHTPSLSPHILFHFFSEKLSEVAASKTKPHQGSCASECLQTESLTLLVAWCKPEPWHGEGVTGVNERMLLRGQTWCC